MNLVTPSTPPAGPTLGDLPAILDGLIAAHERLLVQLDEHRDAIGRADAHGLGRAVAEETETLRVIADLDGQRRRALGLPPRPAGPAPAGLRMSGAAEISIEAVAKTLPPAEGAALAERAQRLRPLLLRAREKQSVIRAASESMLGHLSGVMGRVHAGLNRAGTYGRTGRVEAGQTLVRGLDASG